EHRSPPERYLDPSADDRGDRRRKGEDHHHETHQLLRLRSIVKIADHGAPHDRSNSGGSTLHHAKGEQSREVGSERAAHRRYGVQRKTSQYHGPPSDGVGERTLDQG